MKNTTPYTNLSIPVTHRESNFRPCVSILRSLSPVTQLVLWPFWFRRIALNVLLATSLVLGFLAEAESSIRCNFPWNYGYYYSGAPFQVSPNGNWVVYRANFVPYGDLYSVPTTGGTPIQLNSSGSVSDFQISPDSNWVVYPTGQELYRVPIAGGTPTKLNGPLVSGAFISHFQISPDGTRVVYTTRQDTLELYELFSVPIDGTDTPTRLDVDGIVWPLFDGFQISPDSTKVIYQFVYIDQGGQVYDHYNVPIEIEGGVSTKLNDSPIKTHHPDMFGGRIHDFQISPDSNWVVYQTDPIFPNSGRFYSVPITGGIPKELYAPPYLRQVSGFRISPNSGSVVFLSGDGTFADLFSVPIDGTDTPKQLNGDELLNDGEVFLFQVTPDSGRVVYRAYEAGLGVYSVAINGGPPEKLNGGPSVWAFQISPDGNQVVYTEQDTNNVIEIYTVPVEGGTPTKLNAPLLSGGNVSCFDISPDSNWVVYSASQETSRMGELYSVTTVGGTVPGNLNTGSVSYFQISPNSDRVIYGPGASRLLSLTPNADAGPDLYAVLGESVDFDGSASFDPEHAIVSYSWDFGDGTVADGITVSHVYTAVGTYTVTLTVTDNGGLQDTDQATVTVQARPVANAGPDIRVLMTIPTTLDGSASYDPDGQIVGYDWDFGDESGGAGATVNHSWASPGNYTVTLNVTDNDGLTATDSATAVVLTPSEAVGDLIVEVDRLVILGQLTEQQSRSLTKLAEEARDMIDQGRSIPASRKLGDFIDKVNALVNSDKLDQAEGQRLIDSARDVVTVIGG